MKKKREMPKSACRPRRGRTMPKKAIRKMLASPNTPEHLKRAWRKKLKGM